MTKCHTSTHKPVTKCPENISEAGYKCVCLNTRRIVNKKNELNMMVEDTYPHIIGITELWASKDIPDDLAGELFRILKNILYIKPQLNENVKFIVSLTNFFL